jgi:hypothetical protein
LAGSSSGFKILNSTGADYKSAPAGQIHTSGKSAPAANPHQPKIRTSCKSTPAANPHQPWEIFRKTEYKRKNLTGLQRLPGLS